MKHGDKYKLYKEAKSIRKGLKALYSKVDIQTTYVKLTKSGMVTL